MEMLIIMFIQIILFMLICITFKYRNRIIYVLGAFGTMIPILGIVSSSVLMIWSYVDAFSSYGYDSITLKDNKLNNWLYADYFQQYNEYIKRYKK